MAEQPVCVSAHYLMLVDAGRGVLLRDFVMALLGAHNIHQLWRGGGESGKASNLLTVYLRVPATRLIIEIREVIRQIVVENQSNAEMCVYVENVAATYNQVLQLGVQLIISEADVGHSRILRIRDIWGFIWRIASLNMQPPMLPAQTLRTHYQMFINRPLAREAFDWYIARFGAVLVQEYHGPMEIGQTPQIYKRYLLRIGTEMRHVLLEIVETFGNPMIPYDSNEVIHIFTHDLLGFTQRIGQAGDAHIDSETDQDEQDQPILYRVRDPFGYHWQIESADRIPFEVFFANNN